MGLSYFTTYRKRILDKYYDSNQHADDAEKTVWKYFNDTNENLQEAANETDGK